MKTEPRVCLCAAHKKDENKSMLLDLENHETPTSKRDDLTETSKSENDFIISRIEMDKIK